MIEFPKWQYHPTLDAVIVQDQSEQDALGKDWQSVPCAALASDEETFPSVDTTQDSQDLPKGAKKLFGKGKK